MHELLLAAAALSDRELLSRLASLARREREATVDVVAHLAEVETRKLHVSEGYGSLFAYCTGALRLAEHAAYNRIEAARLARRFPALLDLLAEGALNLSTARLLAPYLRPDNFDAVVGQAKGRSKRDVEVLVARLDPRPDVVASVRRLPPSRPASKVLAPASALEPASATGTAQPPVVPTEPMLSTAAAFVASLPPPVVPTERPVSRASVTPLAPDRHRVQFTIDAATREKLARVQDLLRREVPNGDPGAIFSRALDLLLADVARRKLAVVQKPRPRSAPGGRGRRNIPAAVKRAVWVRDGGHCAFATAKGRRCTERAFLEFHHRVPYAMGGDATVANISLRCQAHNAYEADVDFGRERNSPRGELMAQRVRAGALVRSDGRTGASATLSFGP